MKIWELLLIAVGLSMDAFAVAMCKGLAMRRLSYRNIFLTGAFFGGFQALMAADRLFFRHGIQGHRHTGQPLDRLRASLVHRREDDLRIPPYLRGRGLLHRPGQAGFRFHGAAAFGCRDQHRRPGGGHYVRIPAGEHPFLGAADRLRDVPAFLPGGTVGPRHTRQSPKEGPRSQAARC